jgi:hypothetical protein
LQSENPGLFAKGQPDGFRRHTPGFSEISRRVVPFIHNQIRVRFALIDEVPAAADAYGLWA